MSYKVATRRRALFRSFILALLLAPWALAGARGQAVPRPPCEAVQPYPAYGAIGAGPAGLIWSEEAKWTPPPCTDWRQEGSEIGIALAGTFAFTGTAEDLLARFGAVSMLRGVRYWSVSDTRWQTLIDRVSAVAGPDQKLARADFTVAEMRAGNPLYFTQRDNRTSQDVLYRMRVVELTADHLSIEIENASAMRYYFVPLYRAGALQSWFFIDRLGPGTWAIYSLSRSVDTPRLLPGDARRSSANRALALYRHFIGEQTDHEPPLAP